MSDRISFAEYGNPEGFPILIQHGLIASIKDAALFARLAANGARLICIARPGYGESAPHEMTNIGEWGDIVSTLVERLDLRQFDVLGMSSGAPYSYAIAWRLPEKARNVFVFSGIPALYDEAVLAHWPFPVDRQASLAGLQTLADEVFFSGLPAEALASDDIRDSMMHHNFGIALDFKLRCQDWGFRLSQRNTPVYMQHSRNDSSIPLVTAEMTARLLPNCRLEVKDSDVHFSTQALDEFIQNTILAHSTY